MPIFRSLGWQAPELAPAAFSHSFGSWLLTSVGTVCTCREMHKLLIFSDNPARQTLPSRHRWRDRGQERARNIPQVTEVAECGSEPDV